jgi:hypothetical protein
LVRLSEEHLIPPLDSFRSRSFYSGRTETCQRSLERHLEGGVNDTRAYRNLLLGFRLELEQSGNRVMGDGRKVSENGAALPARRRTTIRVEGTLEGNRLALDFAEMGARRKSAGRFVLYLAKDGSFRGRFKSDAAQSSGVTIAVREVVLRPKLSG